MEEKHNEKPRVLN